MHKDQIEVICGPMFSGKTEELIRRLRRAQIARQRVIVFKPAIDQRYDAQDVVSHSAQRILSVPVVDVKAMYGYLEKIEFAVDVVGVDEVQFFDGDISLLAESLASRHIRVILAGLDQDYLGEPFGPIPDLLARADLITKQTAVCVVCGASASKTQRITGTKDERLEPVRTEQVLIGESDVYEARCRGCHVPRIDLPKAAPKLPLVHEEVQHASRAT